MRIGAHVPSGGSLSKAVDHAVAAGCETIQVFCSNPRQWAEPAVDEERDASFREQAALADVVPVFVHAPYLANFATTNDETFRRSRGVMAWTLRRAAAIGAAGVVVHCGSDTGGGRERGLSRFREAVLPLLDEAPQGPRLLLEPTAGQRNSMASRFEELAELVSALDDHERIGICLDTCHAHAAGYDLGDPDGARAALDELAALLGPRLALVHANDSVDQAGSHRDRHAPIGEGTIGEAGFAALLGHPAFRDVPLIIELPGEPADHARSIDRLKRLRP